MVRRISNPSSQIKEKYISPAMRPASLDLLNLLCTSEMSGITEDLAFCSDSDTWFQGTETLQDNFVDWF